MQPDSHEHGNCNLCDRLEDQQRFLVEMMEEHTGHTGAILAINTIINLKDEVRTLRKRIVL